MRKRLLASLTAAFVALSTFIAPPALADDAALIDPESEPAGIHEPALVDAIHAYLADKTGDYSVSVREIGGTGRFADVLGAKRREPASTIKTFYAWLALRQVDRGKLSLSTTLAGGATLGQCIRLMISVSDNECSIDIRLKLGNRWINKQLKEAGFSNTYLILDSAGTYKSKRTSTQDLAILLRRIDSASVLSEASTKRLKSHLSSQAWRSRISSGVPYEARVWSKSGELKVAAGIVEADTAIVQGPTTRYVLTVIGEKDATKAAVRGISTVVYEYFEGDFETAVKYPSAQFRAKNKIILRAHPGSSKVLATIPEGGFVRLIYSVRKWYYVKYGTKTGVVYFTSVTLRPEYLWPHAV